MIRDEQYVACDLSPAREIEQFGRQIVFKLNLATALALLLAILVTGGVSATAQEMVSELVPSSEDSIELRMMQLESELASLRSVVSCSQTCKSSCSTKCQRSRGLEAGYSFFFAKPQMKESFQATVTDFATGTLSLVPFSFDYDLTPRVWLGYFGENGTGIRARYWQYDHNADSLMLTATPTTFPGATSISVIFPAAISTLAPGDTLNIASGLEVHTVDVEGAMRTKLSGLELLVSGGFRYASMKQHFDSVVTSGVAPIGVLNWDRKFEGGGLTVGAEAKKSLASTRLSAFGSARGSLLYGEKKLTRSVFGDVTPPQTATPPFVVLDDADEVSGIFELSAGLEWSRPTQCFGNLFVRGEYETQLWTAAGAPTLTFLGFDGVSLSIGLER